MRKDLTRALQRKRPRINLDDVLLHQDNAPAHTAEQTRLDIGLLGFGLVDHPPYSPDLAPMDFRVFPVVKSALQGHRYDNFQELSYAAQRVVSGLEADWYVNMFDQWIARHEKCVRLRGDYIEK